MNFKRIKILLSSSCKETLCMCLLDHKFTWNFKFRFWWQVPKHDTTIASSPEQIFVFFVCIFKILYLHVYHPSPDVHKNRFIFFIVNIFIFVVQIQSLAFRIYSSLSLFHDSIAEFSVGCTWNVILVKIFIVFLINCRLCISICDLQIFVFFAISNN